MNTLKNVLLVATIAVVSTPAHAQVSLQGSPESMTFQNETADRLSLPRIEESHLQGLKDDGSLVPLPEGEAVRISPQLQSKYRLVRPWTRDLIIELSTAFHDQFGVPLQINSAVRTVEHQKHLIRTNINAARGLTPESRSSHLTGATIDIAKRGLTSGQRAWMQARLRLYEETGKVEATEEHKQLVFHVMVLK